MPVATETQTGLETFADQIKRSELLLDIETAIAHERMAIPPHLYGISEFARALGWYRQKVHNYTLRGTLPEPIGYVGHRPIWTQNQVVKYALENGLEFKEMPPNKDAK